MATRRRYGKSSKHTRGKRHNKMRGGVANGLYSLYLRDEGMTGAKLNETRIIVSDINSLNLTVRRKESADVYSMVVNPEIPEITWIFSRCTTGNAMKNVAAVGSFFKNAASKLTVGLVGESRYTSDAIQDGFFTFYDTSVEKQTNPEQSLGKAIEQMIRSTPKTIIFSPESINVDGKIVTFYPPQEDFLEKVIAYYQNIQTTEPADTFQRVGNMGKSAVKSAVKAASNVGTGAVKAASWFGSRQSLSLIHI